MYKSKFATSKVDYDVSILVKKKHLRGSPDLMNIFIIFQTVLFRRRFRCPLLKFAPLYVVFVVKCSYFQILLQNPRTNFNRVLQRVSFDKGNSLKVFKWNIAPVSKRVFNSGTVILHWHFYNHCDNFDQNFHKSSLDEGSTITCTWLYVY